MAGWHYTEGDEHRGPVDASEIERLIAVGTIGADTMVWQAGRPDWEPAGAHFEFADATPPPLRSPAAASPDIGADGLYVGAPSREFVEAAKVCLSKYATFSGRASRSEFWFFILFSYMASFVAQIVDVALILGIAATGVPFFVPILTVIVMFGLLLPQLAVSWRRLHDIDRTGWWLGGGMLASVAFYAGIIGIVVAQEVSGGLSSEPPASLLALVGVFALAMFVYGITVFIFYVTKGTPGPNRFG